MSFPAQTTGLGVAAKVAVAGNVNGSVTTPGKNDVHLSLSGTNTFQLVPVVEDASGRSIGALTLTAVAAAIPGALVLTAAAVAGVYTGTITGGAANAFVGRTFDVAGFTNAANNGAFVCTASSATVLTLANANSIAETHAATATDANSTATYTGTITGGAGNALAGESFTIAGFTGSNNNGTFLATGSTGTTLILNNVAATAETHAATARNPESTGTQHYVVYGFSAGTTGSNPETELPVATVSGSGLITGANLGHTVLEVSYPTFDNTTGNVNSPNNVMNGLPLNKVYAEVNILVGP